MTLMLEKYRKCFDIYIRFEFLTQWTIFVSASVQLRTHMLKPAALYHATGEMLH